jgi:hypothetical protein
MAEKKSAFTALVNRQLDTDVGTQQPIQISPESVSQSPDRLIGRKRGKSSDPNYIRLTTYIRRDTFEELQRRNVEFSEGVQIALEAWLKS